ncbi:MAG TPA: hypothetical protein PLT66_00260 [Bacillota bacterium]|nr:hypothetical protein [Bacillota bacterium]
MLITLVLVLLVFVLVLASCQQNGENSAAASQQTAGESNAQASSDNVSSDESVPSGDESETPDADYPELSYGSNLNGAFGGGTSSYAEGQKLYPDCLDAKDLSPETLIFLLNSYPIGDGGAEYELTDALLDKQMALCRTFIESFDTDTSLEIVIDEDDELKRALCAYKDITVRADAQGLSVLFGDEGFECSDAVTCDNVLDLEIPYLDELFDYYSIDRSTAVVLDVTGAYGWFIYVFAQGSDTVASALSRAFISVYCYVDSDGKVLFVGGSDISGFDSFTAAAISYDDALKLVKDGTYYRDAYDMRELGTVTDDMIKGCCLIYTTMLDSDYYIPCYCFSVVCGDEGTVNCVVPAINESDAKSALAK